MQMMTKTLATLCTALLVLAPGCGSDDGLLTGPGDSVQSSFDDTLVPADIRGRYLDDATVLARRRMHEEDGPLPSQVRIPTDLIQSYYRPLILVYNATRLAARDDVVTTFSIHAFENPRLRDLGVTVFDSTAWMTTWLQGGGESGNAVMDSLIAEYGLRVDHIHAYVDSHTFWLKSVDPLDMEALALFVQTIPGIKYAGANYVGTLGGGPPADIQAVELGGQRLLEYSSSGILTLSRYHWFFATSSGGIVTFLGDTRPDL